MTGTTRTPLRDDALLLTTMYLILPISRMSPPSGNPFSVTNTGTLLYFFLIQFSNLRNPHGATCNGKQFRVPNSRYWYRISLTICRKENWFYQISRKMFSSKLNAWPAIKGNFCSLLYPFHSLQLTSLNLHSHLPRHVKFIFRIFSVSMVLILSS
jgi:hypothetical protein